MIGYTCNDANPEEITAYTPGEAVVHYADAYGTPEEVTIYKWETTQAPNSEELAYGILELINDEYGFEGNDDHPCSMEADDIARILEPVAQAVTPQYMSLIWVRTYSIREFSDVLAEVES